MSKRISKILILIILTFPFTGCYRNRSQTPPPPPVTITQVKQQDVPIYVNSIGQVIAPSTVFIRPQVAGKLIKANFEQGALVKEGDVLYEIDPRPYQAILDEAMAQLKHDEALLWYANEAVQRYKKVVEQEFLAVLTYDQYVSNAEAAQGQVNLDKASIWAAQINVDFCKVLAPVSGKISYSNVYVGNILAVDDANQITTLLPLNPIDITFSLPQSQFELIRHVQGNEGEWKFTASLPENPKLIFQGTTYFIDNQINQNTGTILLKGRIQNNDLALWPGEFIRVNVLYNTAPNALTVPPSAVLIGKDGPYIYLVDKDGKAEAQNVTVLTRTEAYIAIQSENVHPGDTVITDGQINVAPGLKVSIAAK